MGNKNLTSNTCCGSKFHTTTQYSKHNVEMCPMNIRGNLLDSVLVCFKIVKEEYHFELIFYPY